MLEDGFKGGSAAVLHDVKDWTRRVELHRYHAENPTLHHTSALGSTMRLQNRCIVRSAVEV